MTLFCDGPVILPQHVVFPPDLEANRYSSEDHSNAQPLSNHFNERQKSVDLSLASAVRRHVQFVYEQANRNQRRTAKLLGISRATLARHLRNAVQNQSTRLAH